jgi:hypothetical protein
MLSRKLGLVPVSVTALPPSTAVAYDRVFVDITPDKLWDMIKGKMINERDRLIKPFIGKWINISVVVDDVSSNDGIIWADGVKLSLHFDSRWNDRLEVLQKGQRVSVA